MTLVSGIDPGVPQAGGTRVYVLELAKRLAARGVSVSLIARRSVYEPPNGLRYIPIPSGPSGVEFLLSLIARAPRLGISPDSIVHAQRPDILLPFLVRTRNPKVCTLHGIPSRAVRRLRGRTYGFLFDKLERVGLECTDRVIAVDEETAKWYRHRYPRLSARIRVAPVAVDTEVFRPRDRERSRKQIGVTEEHALLFAGRLTREKRVHLIIRAVRDLPHTELLIAGDGPEEPRLRKMARGAPVRFLGPIPHEQMPILMSAADILVLSSEYEGLPTVVLEAWACGVPVVTTRVGALPSLIVSGRTGWAVEDTEDLAASLATGISMAAGMKSDCVAAAREFSWDSVIERILAVYREATTA